jgi:hypothetical protein
MKIKTIFILSAASLFFSFSFKENQAVHSSNFEVNNTDSTIRVDVIFDDVPKRPGSCGIMLVKMTYKFRLTPSSRYLILSKDGMIKIEFTCPAETGKSIFLKDKVYHFFITPEKKLNNMEGQIKELQSNSDIPLYTYAGG